MKYNYGTSGFRYNSRVLIEIAVKIGKYLSYYASHSNKFIGIIITASHNPHKDNGVKILDSNGFMMSSDDELLCTQYINNDLEEELLLGENIPKVLIGIDTRRTGPLLRRLIVSGILSISKDAIIEDLDVLSTPQIHYELVSLNQKIKILYEDYFFKDIELRQNIIVDCANGVGTKVLQDLEYPILVNTNVESHSLLNNKCGSDYVCSNQCLPTIYGSQFKQNQLYASLDGDADRCIFFYKDNEGFHLLNGDYISVLYCLFLHKYTSEKVTYIHTSYTNHGLINYLKSLEIECICVPTGVKYLQNEAKKHDLSVYFESNGHGSVHYNSKIYDNSCEEIKKMLKMQNQYTGDGVSHIYAVDYILTLLDFDKSQWSDLYKNNDSRLYKLEVEDKNIYKCDVSETQLIEPLEVKEKVESLMKDHDCFIFIRPSGTENVLRIYIENLSEENSIDFDKLFRNII